MKNKLKGFINQFFLINDSPHKIAAGAAVGVFLGIAPGEGFVATLLIASLLKLNRLSATLAVAATNMWTTLVFLPVAAGAGGIIFGIDSTYLISEFQKSYDMGYKHLFTKLIVMDIALPLLVGYIIVAGLFSLIVYGALFISLKYSKR